MLLTYSKTSTNSNLFGVSGCQKYKLFVSCYIDKDRYGYTTQVTLARRLEEELKSTTTN